VPGSSRSKGRVFWSLRTCSLQKVLRFCHFLRRPWIIGDRIPGEIGLGVARSTPELTLLTF